MTRGSVARRLLPAAFAATLVAPAFGDQTVQVGPGMVFSPSTVTVAPGEAVHWEFQETHTTTSDSQSGAETWDSGLLSTGTFSHTFNASGTYPYYCSLHSFPGGTLMNGVVVVSGAGTTPTPIETPTGPATATPTPTATPSPPPPTVTATVPPATATPIAGGPAEGVPALESAGRIALVLALGAAGFAVLFLTARR